MDRVEVSRGAATSVFGDRAMSGAIGIFTRPREARHVLAEFEAGNEEFAGCHAGLLRPVVRLGHFRHGPRLHHGWLLHRSGTHPRRSGPHGRGALRHRRFARGPLHPARQHFLQTRPAGRRPPERHGADSQLHRRGHRSLRYAREFAHEFPLGARLPSREGFHSSFSSVSANRNTERLTYTQTVPSEAAGGAAVWRREGAAWHLMGGADVDRIAGTSTDHVLPTGQRVGGGVQWQQGVFGQADAALGPARFFAGLRHSFAGQGSRFLSPSAGVAAGKKRVRVRASVYRAFRAPTLNELYREFRVGNTDTLANPNLRPETAVRRRNRRGLWAKTPPFA